MSLFHVDPHRPHIDGAAIFCPGCGQSYDTIRGDFVNLPPHHYRQLTTVQGPGGVKRETVGVASIGGTWREHGLCPVDCDHLVAHLFRAQIAAAQEKAA